MKLLLPVLAGLLLLSPLAARAQATTLTLQGLAAQNNLNDLVNGLPSVLPRGESEGTIGSPYADNRWLLARLDLPNGRPLAPVPVKYDVLGRRLLMRRPERPTDSLQLDDQQVRGFVLEEPATPRGPARQRVFRRFAEAPQAVQRTNYVEVLHAGRYTLLKHYKKTLKKASYQGAYSAGTRFDEIEDNTTYYLVASGAAPLPVKLGLKNLQAAAPPLANAIKVAADAQKPKTDADWAAVLNAADPAPAK